MRGGPRQILDSQRGGGGEGGVHQEICIERGGLPNFLFLFYFQTNAFSVHTSQFKANAEKGYGIGEIMSQYYGPEGIWRDNCTTDTGSSSVGLTL